MKRTTTNEIGSTRDDNRQSHEEKLERSAIAARLHCVEPRQRVLAALGPHSRVARGGLGGAPPAPPCSMGTGKPRLRMRAAMPGSRPRNARYASAGSTVLPAENTSSWSRLARVLS